MNDIERYLRRATRGTWGRKRADIREELAAHIHERVQIHRIGGLNEDAAIEKALAELGEAGQVSAGMMKLHSMPTLLGSSLLCICALALFLTTFSESVAQQLSGSFNYPVINCTDSATVNCEAIKSTGAFWVTEDALNEALEPQGADILIALDTFSLKLPDDDVVTYTIGDAGSIEVGDEILKRQSDTISLWNILQGFAQTTPNVEISVSGWEQPNIRLGELDLTISALENTDSQNFYESYLLAAHFQSISNCGVCDSVFYYNIVSEDAKTLGLSVTTSSREGDVYGLVTPTSFNRKSSTSKTEFDLSVMRSNAAGQLEFPSNSPNTTFLETLPDEPQENVSILVKLAGGTNGNWYEIVSPEDITVN